MPASTVLMTDVSVTADHVQGLMQSPGLLAKQADVSKTSHYAAQKPPIAMLQQQAGTWRMTPRCLSTIAADPVAYTILEHDRASFTTKVSCAVLRSLLNSTALEHHVTSCRRTTSLEPRSWCCCGESSHYDVFYAFSQ
eukprot:2090887-Amphidinium_carterae.1